MHSDAPNIDNASVTAIQETARTLPPRNPNAPQVAFRSPLSDRMTRLMEAHLIDRVKSDMQKLDQELGRTDTHINSLEYGREWWRSGREGDDRQLRERLFSSFFGRRQIFEATYENNLEWRRSIPGAVFSNINLTLSTSRRITNQRIARYNRFFFETNPWWAAQPVGGATDKEFARKLQKIADLKLRESGSNEEFRLSLSRAAIIGEAVLYTQRYIRDEAYLEELTILVDVAGEPIIAHDGDYIQENDIWIHPTQMMAIETPEGQPPAVGPDGMPQQAMVAVPDQSRMVLARDKVTERPVNSWEVMVPGRPVQTGAQFVDQVVDRRAVHYHGARTSLVNSRDFLCGLTERDIQTAPIIVHHDRISIGELASQYAANPDPETIQNAADLLNGALRGSITAQEDSTAPASTQPNAARREYAVNPQAVEGMLDVAHVYMRCDPLSRGQTSDIYILIDVKRWIPIYYHFTAACSPTRTRPYRIVRTSAVEGRWYGQGEMEQFHNVNMLIDLFLCAAARTQSTSGRVVFWKPQNTEEGQQDPRLKFEWGTTYTLIGDHTKEDTIGVEVIPDTKSVALLEMLQILLQSATNESGTASANDAAAAGLDTQETATGINSINNSGNELTSLPVAVLRAGLTPALEDFVGTTYRFHDEAETFTIFEGDVPVEFQLEPRELSNVRVNCSIMLTNYENERQFKQSQHAQLTWKDWRNTLAMDPMGAASATQLWVQSLQALGTDNATELINPMVAPPIPQPTDVKPPGTPGAAGVGPQPIVPDPNKPPLPTQT